MLHEVYVPKHNMHSLEQNMFWKVISSRSELDLFLLIQQGSNLGELPEWMEVLIIERSKMQTYETRIGLRDQKPGIGEQEKKVILFHLWISSYDLVGFNTNNFIS